MGVQNVDGFCPQLFLWFLTGAKQSRGTFREQPQRRRQRLVSKKVCRTTVPPLAAKCGTPLCIGLNFAWIWLGNLAQKIYVEGVFIDHEWD